jgi:hypothetical protein
MGRSRILRRYRNVQLTEHMGMDAPETKALVWLTSIIQQEQLEIQQRPQT